MDHAIVPLRDGSLLMSMFGYFKTDTAPSQWALPKWKLYRFRTWVMRSTDRGRNWDYRATVAYDPTVGSEGFCEPGLLLLPDGDILCFMAHRRPPVAEYATPLYMNISKDDGKTWSKPAPILDRGVWPSACRMRRGARRGLWAAGRLARAEPRRGQDLEQSLRRSRWMHHQLQRHCRGLRRASCWWSTIATG